VTSASPKPPRRSLKAVQDIRRVRDEAIASVSVGILITDESVVGQGATFIVRLPTAQQSAPAGPLSVAQ
jgi:hypothetical protein